MMVLAVERGWGGKGSENIRVEVKEEELDIREVATVGGEGGKR